MAEKVSQKVFIAGGFIGADRSILTVQIDLSFDIDPKLFTPSTSMIVTRELQNSIIRMIEEARKPK